MMFEQYPDILSVEEACEALRIGYNAMYELLNSGKVIAYKNGRTWKIPRASLTAYVMDRTGSISDRTGRKGTNRAR